MAKKDIVAHFQQQAGNNPGRKKTRVSPNEVQEQRPTAALATCSLPGPSASKRTERKKRSSGLQVIRYIIVYFLPDPFPLLWSSGTQGHNCSACLLLCAPALAFPTAFLFTRTMADVVGGSCVFCSLQKHFILQFDSSSSHEMPTTEFSLSGSGMSL